MNITALRAIARSIYNQNDPTSAALQFKGPCAARELETFDRARHPIKLVGPGSLKALGDEGAAVADFFRWLLDWALCGMRCVRPGEHVDPITCPAFAIRVPSMRGIDGSYTTVCVNWGRAPWDGSTLDDVAAGRGAYEVFALGDVGTPELRELRPDPRAPTGGVLRGADLHVIHRAWEYALAAAAPAPN